MATKLALISVAFLLGFAINQTFASPLARTREHAHESNSLVNLNGFMNDLKTRLRGELAMLMALEEESQERSQVGPHPLRNRPMPFGAQSLLADRDRRTGDDEGIPAHPLAGWGSLMNRLH